MSETLVLISFGVISITTLVWYFASAPEAGADDEDVPPLPRPKRQPENNNDASSFLSPLTAAITRARIESAHCSSPSRVSVDTYSANSTTATELSRLVQSPEFQQFYAKNRTRIVSSEQEARGRGTFWSLLLVLVAIYAAVLVPFGGLKDNINEASLSSITGEAGSTTGQQAAVASAMENISKTARSLCRCLSIDTNIFALLGSVPLKSVLSFSPEAFSLLFPVVLYFSFLISLAFLSSRGNLVTVVTFALLLWWTEATSGVISVGAGMVLLFLVTAVKLFL